MTPSTNPDHEMEKVMEEYGEWLIWHAPSPLKSRHMDWHFARKDFTSERDGDAHSGSCDSLEEARQMCDFIDDMDAEDESPEGKVRLEASAKRLTEKAMEQIAHMHMARAFQQVLALPGINNLPGFATGLHLQTARNSLERYLEYYPSLRTPAPQMETPNV
jgi:hypothetical protein